MMMHQQTPREKALGGNGDLVEWMDVESDKARGVWPADCQGAGDPDPKYDLAPLLEESFLDMVFIRRWERFFDDHSKGNDGTNDTRAANDSGKKP